VKLRVAGVGSVAPLFDALTSNVCGPLASGEVGVCLAPGPEHAPNACASKRHLKVDPVSDDAKRNVGVLSVVVPDGPAVIVVWGKRNSAQLSVTAPVWKYGASPSTVIRYTVFLVALKLSLLWGLHVVAFRLSATGVSASTLAPV
jgi:hypothetical protein